MRTVCFWSLFCISHLKKFQQGFGDITFPNTVKQLLAAQIFQHKHSLTHAFCFLTGFFVFLGGGGGGGGWAAEEVIKAILFQSKSQCCYCT